MKISTSRLALATALFSLAQAPAALAETKVGLLLPTSGPYAALGKEITEGFLLAINESGRKDITVISEDTEAKPPVGLAKARKLVLQDNVDVLSGVVSSGVLGAMRDFVDQSKVPLIVSNAGNDSATGTACSKYITRVSFSNGQVNRPMGKWMYDKGIRKVYTLAPDYAAGREMIDAFKKTFVAAGGQIVGEEYTPFGKTEDFGPNLTNAQAAKPDAVFVFYAGGEAIKFVKQYESFGLSKSIPLYGSGFLTSALYVNVQGAAANGVITSLHYVPSLATPENKAFSAAFKQLSGRVPSEYAVQGYDAGRMLVEALKSGATGREALAAALPKVKYTGPRGPLEIDPATNNVVQNIYIYKTVQNGANFTQEVLDTIRAVKDEPNGCKF